MNMPDFLTSAKERRKQHVIKLEAQLHLGSVKELFDALEDNPCSQPPEIMALKAEELSALIGSIAELLTK